MVDIGQGSSTKIFFKVINFWEAKPFFLPILVEAKI